MNIRERLQNAGSTAQAVLAAGEAAAAQFRLPFGRQSWRGQAGNWAGAGTGSSIDFQDHRPYVPGDDPRYINWQAYARSGHYTMKLYREEVRPQVDLVLDVSESMFVEPAKTVRALELFYFACYSVWRAGAQLAASLASAGEVLHLEAESLRRADWTPPAQADKSAAPEPDALRLNARSMRVVISDFLFEQEPSQWLPRLAAGGSQTVLLCVYTEAEAQPDWLGDVQLLDCESGERVHHHFTREELDAYRRRYEGHFALWREQATRQQASLLRIAATGSLAQQLLHASSPHGGVELCN